MGIEAVVNIILAFIAIASAVYGAYKHFKEGQTADGLADARETLKALITAIEAAPVNAQTTAIKATIERMATFMDVQEATLGPLVQQVTDALKKSGVLTLRSGESQETRISRIARAATAIDLVEERRKALAAERAAALVSASKAVLPLFFILALGIAGCVQDTRLTKETYFPSDSARGRTPRLVVEWPKPVKTNDVFTVDVNGFAQSVAVLPAVTTETVK